MSSQFSNTSEAIVRFAPKAKAAVSEPADPLDTIGQGVMGLLHRAADVAEANSQRALEVAHKLSAQLQNAESRIKELEGDVRYYQDRADRAEKWMAQISAEIEERFLRQDESRQTRLPPPQRGPKIPGFNI